MARHLVLEEIETETEIVGNRPKRMGRECIIT